MIMNAYGNSGKCIDDIRKTFFGRSYAVKQYFRNTCRPVTESDGLYD